MNLSKNEIDELKSGYKILYCKFQILDGSYKTKNSFTGRVASGNYSINADSDIRRTCNLTVSLQNNSFNFNEDIFFNHFLKIYIGFYSNYAKDIVYNSIGIYSFDKESFSYDSGTNEVSFSLVDLSALMDSDHRGSQYGAETIVIPAIDSKTGERLSHDKLVLKNIVTKIITKFIEEHGITKSKLYIGDIGIHSKKDTDKYKWDELPYDLEFSVGSGLLDILKQIRDLYGNYEFFFDVNGNFIFQKTPCTDEDQVLLDETVINDLVIHEDIEKNIYDIKNVVEVWGKTIDNSNGRFGDGYFSNGTYNVTLDDYTETGYVDEMQIALKIDEPNSSTLTNININGLGDKPVFVYDKNLEHSNSIPLKPNTLVAGNTYVFKYSSAINGFYYLNSYQIHAVSILTNGSMSKDYANDSERLEYFSKKYNTTNILFVKDENSKYCIENIGEIVKVFSGNNYANLDNDSITLSYAETKLNRLSRRMTSLTLNMLIVPWLDVNQKIQYKPSNSDEVKTYITKSISGDLLSGTMTVNLMEFYPTLDTEQ